MDEAVRHRAQPPSLSGFRAYISPQQGQTGEDLVKVLHIFAAGALIMPAVAIAQSTPDDQQTMPKSKHGKKHKDAMTPPDSTQPSDTTTMATPAGDPMTTTPEQPGATPPQTPEPAPTPPRQ
ncbi:MAG: hypothetical protein QM688_13535 [Sphingomonas bacterium]